MKKIFILFISIFFVFSCSDKKQIKSVHENANYKKGESFLYKNNDSAFYYFNKVTTSTKDSLEIAMSYNNMAIIQSGESDYFGSQESLLTSLRFLNDRKERDFGCLSSDYNELALNSLNLKNYDRAINYYDLALKFSNSKASQLVLLNNKASVYQYQHQYLKALKIYNAIISEKKRSQVEYARISTNISFTKWLHNPKYNAEPELLKALKIRIHEKDLWGQNSSYAHLTDYYSIQKPQVAFLYAEKMYDISKKISSPDDQREALQKLIKLSSPQETKKYFASYQKLDDSIQTARNAAKNQFALIRYEAEKNKADNLNLQKENNEKNYQITKQRILILSTFLLVITGSIIIILWSKKRKQRLELEAQNTIRENQLRTSKKVHDVVANGLYRVMKEIDNLDVLDRESIVNRLDDMYEKSRDISYENLPSENENFHEKIIKVLKSFVTENIRVGYAGSSPELWKNVNVQAKYEIEIILQELMVNMARHSKGTDVFIRFEQTDTHINIQYSDNGIGISKEIKFNNGITNTGNRIKNIHGTITFDTETEKGLKIRISFPIC